MSQHKESDFVIPVLKTINASQTDCTTEYIKRNVYAYIELTEEDMLPYPSRNKDEPRYYQVIGNLISHRNPTLFKYANFVPVINPDGKTSSIKKFVLNEDGKKYIRDLLLDNEELRVEGSTSYSDNGEESAFEASYIEQETCADDFTIIDPFDSKIMEYAQKHGLDKRPPTDSKIACTVIELSGYKCEYATSIGKRHRLFIGKNKNPFMEGHHLVPMKAAKDFFPLNLDRPSNIASICPGCHALLHHATKDEKRIVLKVLYDNHIEQLNNDGIYISFEKLLEKYY